MIIRATLIIVGAMLFSACDEQSSIKVGNVYTTGPSFRPDGTLLANEILFHYEASEPEPVHIVIDGEIIETVVIDGEVNWNIKVEDRKLKISYLTEFFETPVIQEGILDSKVIVNESKQMAFDISVDDHIILTIKCPSQIVSQPKITNNKQNKAQEPTPNQPSD